MFEYFGHRDQIVGVLNFWKFAFGDIGKIKRIMFFDHRLQTDSVQPETQGVNGGRRNPFFQQNR